MNDTMKIKSIRTVTKNYTSKSGSRYQIVRIELIDIPEDLRHLYADIMYGTIPHEFIDGNGKLNRPLCLADMRLGRSVADALRARELIEQISMTVGDNPTVEDIVEACKTMFARQA